MSKKILTIGLARLLLANYFITLILLWLINSEQVFILRVIIVTSALISIETTTFFTKRLGLNVVLTLLHSILMVLFDGLFGNNVLPIFLF